MRLIEIVNILKSRFGFVTSETDQVTGMVSLLGPAGEAITQEQLGFAGGGSAISVTISGTTDVGDTLTAVLPDGWTATGYQWTRNGSSISGATASTYELTADDAETAVSVIVAGFARESGPVTVGAAPAVLVSVALIPFGDSRTAILQYDTSHIQSSNHSFHNWANMLYDQPFEITGNFGVGGETTVQMQARITAAIASKKAGKKNFITLLCGVNDIGLLLDSAATVWGRVQAFAEEAMAAGVRPILFTDPGSEAWDSAKVTKVLAFNSLMTAWVETQQTQPIDIRPALFDYATEMWSAVPTTAITMKTDYCYDGLHAAVIGSWHGGIAFYNFMFALVGGFNLNVPTATNMLLNANFATPTGGTVGSGTSGPVPLSWRSSRDNATVTSIVFSTTADGLPQIVSAANSSNNLAGFKFQQNMVAGDFSPGDVIEGWGKVKILAGSVGLADVSVNVTINYTDTTFETYFEAQSSSGGINNIPSTTDQIVTLRTRPLTINPAKTISAVTYFLRVRFRAEGSGTFVVLPGESLGKIV